MQEKYSTVDTVVVNDNVALDFIVDFFGNTECFFLLLVLDVFLEIENPFQLQDFEEKEDKESGQIESLVVPHCVGCIYIKSFV